MSEQKDKRKDQDLYKEAEKINKDKNKNARVENGKVVVKDVLRG